MGFSELSAGTERASIEVSGGVCVALMKRGDSSFQCCIKDDRRSIAYVVQTGYANHLKLLYSKDMVVNIQAKGPLKGSGGCKEAERK